MDDYFEKLINASDLIEWIMETDPDWCVGIVRSIVDHVESMPPAYSERKKGKWRLATKPTDYFAGYRCSECNELVYGKTNYCPNCGAEMRKGEEE